MARCTRTESPLTFVDHPGLAQQVECTAVGRPGANAAATEERQMVRDPATGEIVYHRQHEDCTSSRPTLMPATAGAPVNADGQSIMQTPTASVGCRHGASSSIRRTPRDASLLWTRPSCQRLGRHHRSLRPGSRRAPPCPHPAPTPPPLVVDPSRTSVVRSHSRAMSCQISSGAVGGAGSVRRQTGMRAARALSAHRDRAGSRRATDRLHDAPRRGFE